MKRLFTNNDLPKVLITGAGGQLGQCLIETAPPNVALHPATRQELDLARLESLPGLLEDIHPAVIINAGAYTAVDRAESDQALARRINAEAVAVIAEFCRHTKCRLVQMSTDFVFGGQSQQPWAVDALTSPVNAYGASKLEGEHAALDGSPMACVVRSGWVYSAHGRNFVKTMLELGRSRTELSVVSDQVGTPTWGRDLAEFLWQVVADWPTDPILHFANGGTATWHSFAAAVFQESVALGLLDKAPHVRAISSAAYGAAAARPAYSVLELSRSIELYGIEPRPWLNALHAMLLRLKQSSVDINNATQE